MNIGEACKKSIRAAKMSIEAQDVIIEYCNKYARKLTGNPEFEYTELPDEIVEPVFYGCGFTPDGGWSKFLKDTIRKDISNRFCK